MTIDRCKNPDEPWITKLQIKSETGKYTDLNDDETYKVVTIAYVAEKIEKKYENEIFRTKGTDLQTEVLKLCIEQSCSTKPSEIGRITINQDCNIVKSKSSEGIVKSKSSVGIVFGVLASIFVVGAIGFLLFKKWKSGKNSGQPTGHSNQNFQIE